jgi:hypothetical protein
MKMTLKSVIRAFIILFFQIVTFSNTLPSLVNTDHVNKISISELGLFFSDTKKIIATDTTNEEDASYYSTVFQITTPCNKNNSNAVFLISTLFSGADKGPYAGEPLRTYLCKKNDTLFFCGDFKKLNGILSSSHVFSSIAKRLKLAFVQEPNVTITELEKRKQIESSAYGNLTIVNSEVMIGSPDTTKLVHLFDIKNAGSVYMSNVNNYIANHPLDFKSKNLNNWIDACCDSSCFETNRFFLFRKDGTFIIYDIKPPILTNATIFNNASHPLGFKEYTSQTLTTCQALSVADATPLSDSFLFKNPATYFGNLQNSNDSFWIFNDSTPILLDAFNILKNANSYWDPNCIDQPVTDDYSAFTRKIPLLFWKDPFGRKILYKVTYLNPPACCEPVFYLYSPIDTTVSIKIKSPEIIQHSNPQMQDGWTIRIFDNDKMFNSSTNQQIPFVFWDGWVDVLQAPANGFMIVQNQLQSFLKEKLSFIGLSGKEIADFFNVWLIKCPQSPYYFVHFYNTEFVNKYCPIKIIPEPQTTIRVYVDIEPCTSIRPYIKQELSSKTSRTGLTFIEWGAVIRPKNK